MSLVRLFFLFLGCQGMNEYLEAMKVALKGNMLPKPCSSHTLKKGSDWKSDLGGKILLGILTRQKVFVPVSSSILLPFLR